MVNYVATINGSNNGTRNKILTEDVTSHDAVYKYKQFMMHCLSKKMEMWHALFLHPVFGMDKLLKIIEFHQSRGGIHFHILSFFLWVWPPRFQSLLIMGWCYSKPEHRL